MKKKGIAWEFIIRLTLAMILIMAAVSFGASLFRKTDAATESFNKFVNKIESAKGWETDAKYDTIRLDMDEGTAIYGFGKDSKEIERWDFDSRGWKKTFNVTRFDDCEDNKACVCLCKKRKVVKWGPSAGDKDKNPGTEICEAPICNSIESIDFQQVTPKMKLLPEGSERRGALKSDIEIRGGFVFYRHAIDQGPVFAIDLLEQMKPGPRPRAVVIEKKGNLIGVCLEYPCI